jgi:thioredoxin reductase (NADPH)
MNTTEVENFPGFPEGIMGPDLMAKMQEQAEKFGTEVVYDDVVKLELTGDVKKIVLGSGAEHEAERHLRDRLRPRKIGIEGESRLSGHGVSYCATCDGFFFREQAIAVVGGGDSAMEEATFLTKFASKVYVIHRRAELRASKIMQERAFANEKIEFVWNSEVVDVLGGDAVSGLLLRDTVDGTERELAVTGVFVAIGNDPRTHLVHDSLRLTEHGTIWVDGRSSRTSVPGSSPPATWSTRSIARRSPPPAAAPPPPSTSSTTSPPAAMPELPRRMPPRSTASKTPPDRRRACGSGTSRHPPCWTHRSRKNRGSQRRRQT